MLARIAAVSEEDSDQRRREIGRLAQRRRRLQRTFRHPIAHGQELETIAISANGRHLVTAAREAVVWDTDSGRRVATLEHPAAVDRLAIDASGTRIATVSAHELRVWTSDGRLLLGPEAIGEGWVVGLAISPLGDRVAIGRENQGAEDGIVELFALDDPPGLRAELSFPGRPWNVLFSPDGRHLAAGAGAVRLWDARDGRLLADPVPPSEEDDMLDHCSAIAFDALGQKLAMALTTPGVLRTWDIEAGAFAGPVAAVPELVNKVAFDVTRGRWIVAEDRAAYASDERTGQPAGRPLIKDDLHDWEREKYAATPVALSPDGTRFAVAGLGDCVRVWDTFTGERLTPVAWHGGVVEHLAFAGNARMVTGSRDGIVRLWSTEPLDAMPRPAVQQSSTVHLAPGAKHALIVRETGEVRIFDLEGGSRRLEHDGVRVFDLAVSADGSTLAGYAQDRSARIWRLPSGELLGDPLYQEEPIWDLALDKTGRRLAIGTLDVARIYDVGRQFPVETAACYVQRMAFDPGGRLLCSTGWGVFESSGSEMRRVATEHEDRLEVAWDGIGYLRFAEDVAFDVTFVDGGGMEHPVGDLAITADRWEAGAGRVFAFEDDRIMLIAPEQLGVVATIDHGKSLVDAALAGGRLTTWGGRSVKSWDPRDGRLLGGVSLESEVFSAVAIPGSDLLAVATTGVEVQVVDARTGDPIGAPLEFARELQIVAFDGSERAILVDASGSMLRVDLSTGRTELLQDLGSARVQHVAISPDGSRLAVVFEPNVIELWDLTKRERVCVWHFKGEIRVHSESFCAHPSLGIPALPVGFDPTGTRLLVAPTCWVDFATGGRSPTSNAQFVVDASTGETICELSLPPAPWIGPAAFDSSGELIAMALFHETVGVWDSLSGERLHSFVFEAVHGTLAFIPETRVLAAAGDDGRFASWDVESGDPIVAPTSLGQFGIPDLSHDARRVHAVDANVVHVIDLLSGLTLIQQANIPQRIQFGPAENEVLLFGELYVHLAQFEGESLVPVATRAAHWTSIFSDPFDPKSVALRADGTAVLGASPTTYGVRLALRDFRNSRSDPILGTSKELREVWSRRLGLELTTDGAILARE